MNKIFQLNVFVWGGEIIRWGKKRKKPSFSSENYSTSNRLSAETLNKELINEILVKGEFKQLAESKHSVTFFIHQSGGQI